jgi:hypothetical protein
MRSAVRCPYFQKAFGWSVPIGGIRALYLRSQDQVRVLRDALELVELE